METKIDREIFTRLCEKYNLYEPFYTVIDSNTQGPLTELPSFAIYFDYEMEQITILERGSLIGVSWYKYAHPGRCLELANIETEEELEEFIKVLVEELRGEYEID